MEEDIIGKLIEIKDRHIKLFGKESFSEFKKIFLLRIKGDLIIKEIDYIGAFYLNELFENSKTYYSKVYNLSKEEMVSISKINSTVDDINLQFYVLINHKFENYEAEILRSLNETTGKKHKDLKNYDLDVHSKKELFNDRDRIRLISNSIKHNNSYPKKQLLHYYPSLKLQEKIKLADFNPKNDLVLIKSHLNYFNLLTFSIIVKETIIRLQQYDQKIGIDLLETFPPLFENANNKRDEYIDYHLNK